MDMLQCIDTFDHTSPPVFVLTNTQMHPVMVVTAGQML